MARILGLQLSLCVATIILHLHATNGAAIRNTEATTSQAETEVPTQVSTILPDSTVPQDNIAQTTLPPISFRTSTSSSTDTTTNLLDNTTEKQPTSQKAVSDLPGVVLPRDQPELGRKPTMADTRTMGSDSTLVPTTELVPIGTDLPEDGISTMGEMVKQSSSISGSAESTITILANTTEMQVPENETKSSDSFIPPTVQVMSYVIDALWEKENRDNHLDDEEPYKKTEDTNYTKKDDSLEDEDDWSSKPVFQTNVPIVNEESVPMRMHMDIVPQGFPEDLEGPFFYPSDYYDDRSQGLYPTVPVDQNEIKDATISEYPWSKGSRYNESPEDIEERVDRFLKIQKQMRFIRYSATFDKLVDIHKNLALYAKTHGIKNYEGFSDNVMVILRHTASGNAAEQLKTVISMIFEESPIDNEHLEDSLKKFLGNLSETENESFLVLRSLPALHYS